MLNISVLVKPVYDSQSIKWDYASESFNYIAPSFNKVDLHALQWASNFKRSRPAMITAYIISEGHQQISLKALEKFTIDKCIVIETKVFKNRPYHTASILAAELSNQKFDLILSGSESEDRHFGTTPIIVAQQLNLPSLTHVQHVEPSDDKVWKLHRKEGREFMQTFHVKLPAVIGVTRSIAKMKYVPRTIAGCSINIITKLADATASSPKINLLKTTAPQPNIKYLEVPDPHAVAQQRATAIMGFTSNKKNNGRQKVVEKPSDQHIHYISQTLKKWLKE